MLFNYIHLFGCIHLPDFPVQATLCSQALLSPNEVRAYFRTIPIAVLDGPDSLLKVSACNEQARKLGIRTGMTKLQAEACPGVELRKRVAEQELPAHRALLDCGYGFAAVCRRRGDCELERQRERAVLTGDHRGSG